jgi:hypothetical protein
MEELLDSLVPKLEEREAPLLNAKLFIFRGALKLVNKKKQEGDLLERFRALPYEELLLESLPDSFFSDSATPTKEYLDWYRKNQLSAPTRLLLDMLFVEELSLKDICELFKISEAVLEPFLFTFFHRLSAEPELDQAGNANELDTFSELLLNPISKSEEESTQNFKFRVDRLRNFFRTDTRQRLSTVDLDWILSRIRPEESEQETEDKEDSSVIEIIRKRNQKLDAGANPQENQDELDSEYYKPTSTPPKDPQQILRIVKPAVVILFFFLSYSFYRTLTPSTTGILPNQSDTEVPTATLDSRDQLGPKILGSYTDSSGDHPLYALRTLLSSRETLYLVLTNGSNMVVSPYSRIRVHSMRQLELLRGEIVAESGDSKDELKLYSRHGALIFRKSSIRFSMWYPSFSVAGVERGTAKVHSENEETELKEGQQIILALGRKLKTAPFSSRSFERPKENSKGRPSLAVPLAHSYSNQLKNEELEKRLLKRKALEGPPTVKQKDFWHKL